MKKNKPTMTENIEAVRAAGGDVWDKVPDPDALIRWMRGGDDSAAETAGELWMKELNVKEGTMPDDTPAPAAMADSLMLDALIDASVDQHPIRTCQARDNVLAELARLRGEVARLREALLVVAKLPCSNPSGDTLHGVCPACHACTALGIPLGTAPGERGTEAKG